MNQSFYPSKILHWIENEERGPAGGKFFPKHNPADGELLAEVCRGNGADVKKAVDSAEKNFDSWSAVPVIKRAEILRKAAFLMEERKNEIAEIIALESGKPKKDALGEANAAIECGFFMAGEGRRYYGEVLNSSAENRSVALIRQSIGAGVLIVPFNNPLAAISWKAFPALLCGNAVVLKSHEDTPYIAVWFAELLKQAGLASGIFSVIQGLGREVGPVLVEDSRIKFISFTGSLPVAQYILQISVKNLSKVSIESGGKNPFVVCDDADLEKAASLAVSSAFIDAGQRCAAASRIIVFSSVYDAFKKIFLEKTSRLKAGINDSDDFGAIINEKRLKQILEAVKEADNRGAIILAGGHRLEDENHKKGYFMVPTVLENVSPKDEISYNELFGPVVILYRAKDFNEAVSLANDSKFKLAAAIHTKNIHRAQEFVKRCGTGVVRINGPTFGSEPHMPFGGLGLSGNGWREPGRQALDFYSEWKQVSIDYDSIQI